MKQRLSILGSIAALALSILLLATPTTAQPQTPRALVQCYGVVTASHHYPVDALNSTSDTGHYRQCFGLHPTATQQQRIGQVEGILLGISTSGAGADMKSRPATFFYFASRDDYNSYVNAHIAPTYMTSTARCGNTYGSKTGGPLISAVFDTCSFANGVNASNQNPFEAMQHEAGHSFTASVALNFGDSGPGQSKGWKQMITDDMNDLDANWQRQPNRAAKDRYICSIFGINILPSTLEIDLRTPTQPVCNANGVNSYPPDKKPSYILAHEFPYFFPPIGGSLPYEEIWANEMIDTTGGPGGYDILRATQHALGNFFCAPSTYHYYYRYGVAPPKSSQIYLNPPCPPPTDPKDFR